MDEHSMAGDPGAFSADWLDLREPVDRGSHDPALLGAIAGYCHGRSALAICDLGAGTGSSLRLLGPLLPPQQRWRLIDHDAANLAAARQRLLHWAARASEAVGETAGGLDGDIDGDALHLWREGRDYRVVLTRGDLAADYAGWPVIDGDGLITASALFDLCSADWLTRFAGWLAGHRLPLAGLLTYDGRLVFDRPSPHDAAMVAAFNRHQRTDKGFGPAAGPDAPAVLGQALAAAGYRLHAGDSSWRLGTDVATMRQAVIDGWAGAAAAVGIADGLIETWRAAHADPADTLTVGHVDLFAVPPA